MRKNAFIAGFLSMLAIAGLAALIGCKTVTVNPSWAPTSAVAIAGESIAAANAAVVQYESDVKAGFVPAAALRTTMSDIQQALTIAQPAFNQWEQAARTDTAAPEPPALPTALNRISSDLAKLPTTAGN